MDKEQLIKLAVVAGLKNAEIMTDEISGEKFVSFLDEFDCWTFWRPHEDIAQAMEMLNTFDNWDMSKGTVVDSKDIFHQITINDSNNWYESEPKNNTSLPEAICSAILKATEQG